MLVVCKLSLLLQHLSKGFFSVGPYGKNPRPSPLLDGIYMSLSSLTLQHPGGRQDPPHSEYPPAFPSLLWASATTSAMWADRAFGLVASLRDWSWEERGKMFFPEQTQMLQIALNGCPALTTAWWHTSLTWNFFIISAFRLALGKLAGTLWCVGCSANLWSIPPGAPCSLLPLAARQWDRTLSIKCTCSSQTLFNLHAADRIPQSPEILYKILLHSCS